MKHNKLIYKLWVFPMQNIVFFKKYQPEESNNIVFYFADQPIDDDHRCLRTHTHSNRDSCAGQGLRLHGGCCRYTVDDVIQRFAFALHHTDYIIYISRLGFVMPTGLRSAVGYLWLKFGYLGTFWQVVCLGLYSLLGVSKGNNQTPRCVSSRLECVWVLRHR